jgi:translation initiation factor IF-1
MTENAMRDATGMLTEILPSGTYRVRLDDGSVIEAYAAGKMRKLLSAAAVGDRVKVQVAVDSPGRGRILR